MYPNRVIQCLIRRFPFVLSISIFILYTILLFLSTDFSKILFPAVLDSSFKSHYKPTHSSFYIFVESSVLKQTKLGATLLPSEKEIEQKNTKEVIKTGLPRGYCWFSSAIQALLSLESFKNIYIDIIKKSKGYKAIEVNDPFIENFLNLLKKYYLNTIELDIPKIPDLYFSVIENTNSSFLGQHQLNGTSPLIFISFLFLKLEKYVSKSTLELFVSKTSVSDELSIPGEYCYLTTMDDGSGILSPLYDTEDLSITINISNKILEEIGVIDSINKKLKEIIIKNLEDDNVKIISSALFIHLNLKELFYNMKTITARTLKKNIDLRMLKRIEVDRKTGRGPEVFTLKSVVIFVKNHVFTCILTKDGEFINTDYAKAAHLDSYRNFNFEGDEELEGVTVIYELDKRYLK